MKLFIVILIVVFSGSIQAAPKGLDVNDVSYFFPLDSQNKPFPRIPLFPGLISQELFLDILAMGEEVNGQTNSEVLEEIKKNFRFKGQVVTDISSWYVVSFRYNHCGSKSEIKNNVLRENSEPCSARLRIVAQPFADLPIDSALHLLFDLGSAPTGKGNFVLKKLMALRDEAQSMGVSTAQRPLQPHPALIQAQNDPSSQFEIKVKNFIHEVLAPDPIDKLEIMTVIATTDVKEWKFIGGKIQKGTLGSHSDWVGFNTPIYENLDALNPLLLSCNSSSLCDFTPEVQPVGSPVAKTLFPTLYELFQTKSVDQYSPSEEILELAEIIDNPKKAHLFNTDCISCHLTGNVRSKESLLIEEQGFPLGITPFVGGEYLVGDGTSILNFGYQQSSPRISVRTAGESAEVADGINKILGVENPGFNCPKEKQNSLWRCLNDPKNFGNNRPCYTEYCL